MIKTKEVNIYALINPIDNNVFYIGCCKEIVPRYKMHLKSEKDNSQKVEIIKRIKAADKTLKILVLDKVDMQDASFWEEFYIGLFKSYGYTLTNKQTKSTYTACHANKYILKNKDVTIPITSRSIEDLERLSSVIGMKTSILIGVALKEFVTKYLPLALNENNDALGLFYLREGIYNQVEKIPNCKSYSPPIEIKSHRLSGFGGYLLTNTALWQSYL